MRSFYAQFWPWHSSATLRKAIIVSLVLHVVIVAGLTIRFPKRLQLTQAGVYSIELANPDGPPSTEVPLGTLDAPPAPPKPVPPPPPPPKKEEPKSKPPEPKKEEPKPKPKPVEPAKEEKPKEEKPKKERPKDEKKEEKKSEKKSEEKPTKVAKNDKAPREISDNPMDDMPTSDGPTRPSAQPPQPTRGLPTGKAGVSMAGGIPNALGAWGGLIQRKVEKEWKVPEGVILGPADDGAVLSFWITRDGELIGEPEVVKHAVDKEVAASAIRAIKAAAPYPPLPESYSDAEVQVFYTFIPTK